MRDKTYISFDWALKRLLRDKANFDVLEGFVSTLLGTTIHIHRLLESERLSRLQSLFVTGICYKNSSVNSDGHVYSDTNNMIL